MRWTWSWFWHSARRSVWFQAGEAARSCCLRHQESLHLPRGPLAPAARVFGIIMEGAQSGSAWEARSKGLLRPSDRVVMNRDHLLAAARTWTIELVSGYVPPAEAAITVSGPSGKSALLNEALSARAAGCMSDTDMAIADFSPQGSMPGSPPTSSRTPTSTARLCAWTAPCAWASSEVTRPARGSVPAVASNPLTWCAVEFAVAGLQAMWDVAPSPTPFPLRRGPARG